MHFALQERDAENEANFSQPVPALHFLDPRLVFEARKPVACRLFSLSSRIAERGRLWNVKNPRPASFRRC